MAKTRRRQAGEGGNSEFPTKAGPRFLIKYPVLREDGTKRMVLRRGFASRRDAAAQLRVEIGKCETGAWVEPSKQRLDAYLAEWIDGQPGGWYPWLRLPFQVLFVAWALWCTGWELRQMRAAAAGERGTDGPGGPSVTWPGPS